MFGYTVARGAVSALVGLGSIYTKLQYDMMQFYYKGKYDEFLALMLKVDMLAETTFIEPMEGYIERVLYVLARQGIIAPEAAYDPYGPGITEIEKNRIDELLSKLGKM